jgi:hypothetical protein
MRTARRYDAEMRTISSGGHDLMLEPAGDRALDEIFQRVAVNLSRISAAGSCRGAANCPSTPHLPFNTGLVEIRATLSR